MCSLLEVESSAKQFIDRWVEIKELGIQGRIKEVTYCYSGLMFLVRYCNEYEFFTVLFYQTELDFEVAQDDNKRISLQQT